MEANKLMSDVDIERLAAEYARDEMCDACDAYATCRAADGEMDCDGYKEVYARVYKEMMEE